MWVDRYREGTIIVSGQKGPLGCHTTTRCSVRLEMGLQTQCLALHKIVPLAGNRIRSVEVPLDLSPGGN